jgi:hypothetical protein
MQGTSRGHLILKNFGNGSLKNKLKSLRIPKMAMSFSQFTKQVQSRSTFIHGSIVFPQTAIILLQVRHVGDIF